MTIEQDSNALAKVLRQVLRGEAAPAGGTDDLDRLQAAMSRLVAGGDLHYFGCAALGVMADHMKASLHAERAVTRLKIAGKQAQ